MKRQPFVIPGETQLALFPDEGGDFYIIVKEKLTFGEAQALQGASMTSLFVGGNRPEGESEVGLDFKRHAILRMLTWILEWNLTDHTGRLVPISKSAIENLDPDVAAEITRVLDEHVKALEGKGRTPITALPSATESS